MKRREPTGEADTGEATAEQAIPEPPHPVLALQGMVGNRATSRAIARRRSADGGIPQHAGLDIAPILAAQIPELLPLIKADDIQKMQHAYDAAQNNAILDQHVREKKADMLAHGIQDSGSEESRAMIASVPGQYESEQGPMFFEVETKDVLSEDILQEQPRNRAAEKAFRKWMYDDLMKAAKVHIKIEANARSAVAGGGIGHDAELYSGGRSLPHTRGKVHFQDLVESSYFKQAYYDRVTHSPELEELKKATHDVFVGVEEMKSEHLERIVLNGEHPVVRRVAEFLGGPGMKEEVEFMLDIIQHPEKGSFADRQDELSTVCPDLSIWEAPTNEAKATLEKLENQDIEMGLLYYMRAEKSFERAARQYQRYEDRVMSGAGLAVKWLNRAKFAGKLAAAAIPGGGVIDAAMMSAVYALAQEGGQQASEVAYGQRSSIDFGGLAKMAATEGAMAFFGGLTQEAFKAALTARVVEKWGAEALASSGTKIMISGTAATASSFYNVGANLALQKIVNGKANMPQDLNGLADLVLDEASSALLTDVGMQGVHMAGEHMETGSKTGEGKPRHEIEEHEQSGKPVEPSGSQHEEQRGGGIGGGGGGGTDPTGGKPPAPKKPAAVELAESAHTSPAAADALIAHYDGRWEDAIHALKKGTGDLSQMSPEARGKVIDTLLQHRQSFLNEIGKKFGAEPKGEPTASGEPESDVDLNMKGDEAGLKVAQATLFLDQAHPGWRTRFRMGLLVDAGRATSIGAHIAELPQHLQNEINQHHTLSSEAALVAREARHAPADAREAIISKIPDPTMREMARAMANATPEEIVDMRTTWLVDADRAFQRLSDTATPAEKARMINEAQDRQMLANSLDDGAYVTGGAIRSVVKGQSPQTAHDSYQTLIDQIAQIGIHAHEKGGMRAGLRDYETFKYIQRIATALEASGVHGDPRIRYLHQQAELVYNVERDAVASEDPRNLTRADLTTKTRHEDPNKRPQMYLSDYDSAGVSESHLEDIYAMTRQVIEDHMPSLRKTALGGDTAAGIPMPVELPPLEPRSPAPAPGASGGRRRWRPRRRGQYGRRRLGRRHACWNACGLRDARSPGREPRPDPGGPDRHRPHRPHIEARRGDDPAVASLEGGSGPARDLGGPEQARVPAGPDEPDRAVDLQAGEGRAGAHFRAVGRDRGAGALAPGGGRLEARQGSWLRHARRSSGRLEGREGLAPALPARVRDRGRARDAQPGRVEEVLGVAVPQGHGRLRLLHRQPGPPRRELDDPDGGRGPEADADRPGLVDPGRLTPELRGAGAGPRPFAEVGPRPAADRQQAGSGQAQGAFGALPRAGAAAVADPARDRRAALEARRVAHQDRLRGDSRRPLSRT